MTDHCTQDPPATETELTGHKWLDRITREPEHSHWYAQRWKDFVAEGKDIDGEARFVDTLAPRKARVFDAGSGTGRVGGYLLSRGHSVVGVDIDPYLVSVAKKDHPDGEWFVGELASFDLAAHTSTNFDVIVSTGNVISLLREQDRVHAFKRFADYLAPEGRMILGFAAGRGYEFADFFADLGAAGLERTATFSTWDMRPFTEDSDFVVALIQKA
ncbi:class I SAM-dependent methyltransferase [Micrococcoides hystricis]|uniref:Class I SAM-dependent methyltransferase n=1 Tax=Micrococcoides hystricis TaxID=1572761 RepID=A0ABV6P8Y3_9MICC